MIPARADVSVCPFFFCVCVPVSVRRNARFLFIIYQTKSACLCIFLFFPEKMGFISFFMETIPALFPSSTV